MAKNRPPTPPSSSDDSASSDEEQTNNNSMEIKTSIPTLKKKNPTTNEEEEESSEEGEEESESEESGNEEDDDEDDADPSPVSHIKKPQPATPSKPSASDDDDDDESGYESEPESAKLVTPISSKPMASPSPILKNCDGSDNGKNKKGKEIETNHEPENKVLFQRVWTLEDELAILKGMAEYQAKKGPVPLSSGGATAALDDFRSFIRGSLSFPVTNAQLVNKIGRLKKRFNLAVSRGKNMAKPHDLAVHELSKKLWDTEAQHEAKAKERSAPPPPNGVVANGGGESSKREYPYLKEAAEKADNPGAVEALELLDPAKARLLEEKFKRQRVAEMKHHLQKMELYKETYKLIMEGVERAG